MIFKRFKKITAFMLALVMALSVQMVGFAEDTDSPDIVIDEASISQPIIYNGQSVDVSFKAESDSIDLPDTATMYFYSVDARGDYMVANATLNKSTNVYTAKFTPTDRIGMVNTAEYVCTEIEFPVYNEDKTKITYYYVYNDAVAFSNYSTKSIEEDGADAGGNDLSGFDFTFVPSSLPYTDVKYGDWFQGDATLVYYFGIMTGTNETTFAPGVAVSRGMFVTMLYRLAGEPEVTGTNTFTDVKSGDWYAKAVQWALDNAITTGYNATTFGSNDTVTREQMSVFLMRYADEIEGEDVSARADLTSFPDNAKVSEFAQDGMSWAVSKGYIRGSQDHLKPLDGASRAEGATVISRYIQN